MFDLVNSAMQVLAQLGEAAPAVQSAAGAAVGAATPALAGAGTSATDVAQGGMLHFISQSDVVGKSLFGILVLMSLTSWYLIFVKCFVNWRISRRSKDRKSTRLNSSH